MKKYPDQTRNFNPTKEARLAMIIWGEEYSKMGGGSMDFYDSLPQYKKDYLKERVNWILKGRLGEMNKPKRVKLILPVPDDEYDEDNDEHAMIALHFDTRIDSPGYYAAHDEIIFAEAVGFGEQKEAEDRVRYLYLLLVSDGVEAVESEAK